MTTNKASNSIYTHMRRKQYENERKRERYQHVHHPKRLSNTSRSRKRMSSDMSLSRLLIPEQERQRHNRLHLRKQAGCSKLGLSPVFPLINPHRSSGMPWSACWNVVGMVPVRLRAVGSRVETNTVLCRVRPSSSSVQVRYILRRSWRCQYLFSLALFV